MTLHPIITAAMLCAALSAYCWHLDAACATGHHTFASGSCAPAAACYREWGRACR